MSTLPSRSADQLGVVARANEILRERSWYASGQSHTTSESKEITLSQAEAFMRALSEFEWIPQEERRAS